VWKRLQHPNIVPFLGVPTKIPPPYEIVFDWMENGTLIDFVAKHPEVDRIGLVRNRSGRRNLLSPSNTTVVGYHGWSPLPPLV
jgi:hypothetical protein